MSKRKLRGLTRDDRRALRQAEQDRLVALWSEIPVDVNMIGPVSLDPADFARAMNFGVASR